MVSEPPPPFVAIELQLAHLVVERRGRAPRVDITWPRHPLDLAA
ncbi:hypothetical protein ACQ7HM_12840 [Williamsia sp. MIQD14]